MPMSSPRSNMVPLDTQMKEKIDVLMTLNVAGLILVEENMPNRMSQPALDDR